MHDILAEFEQPIIARKRKRVFAGFIDLGLSLFLFILILVLFGERYETVEGTIGYRGEGPKFFLPLVFWFFTVPVMEGITGQTIGKKFISIKVVSVDYSKASFGQTLVRHLLDIIDWIPGFGILGLLVASNNKYSQRIGDIAAKTIVVEK